MRRNRAHPWKEKLTQRKGKDKIQEAGRGQIVWCFAKYGMFNFPLRTVRSHWETYTKDSTAFLPFVHLHSDTPTPGCQHLAISGSLIITGWMAEPSHPKEETASKAHNSAAHLSPPSCLPSPRLQAEKYKIHTMGWLAVRGKAKTFLRPHGPSKMFTTGIRYHYPDWRDKQQNWRLGRDEHLLKAVQQSHSCSDHVLAGC